MNHEVQFSMRKLLAIALALLAANTAFTQTSSIRSDKEPDAKLSKFTAAQLLEDFQIARRALEEGHSGIYRYTPKTRLDQIFNDAGRSLDHPMDAYEFEIRSINGLSASRGDLLRGGERIQSRFARNNTGLSH